MDDFIENGFGGVSGENEQEDDGFYIAQGDIILTKAENIYIILNIKEEITPDETICYICCCMNEEGNIFYVRDRAIERVLARTDIDNVFQMLKLHKVHELAKKTLRERGEIP